MRVLALVAGWLLVVTGVSALAQEELGEEPPRTTRPRSGVASATEMLELLGVDRAFFDAFADDRPLDVAEREKLAVLLERMRRLPPEVVDAAYPRPRRLHRLADDPARYRGQLFEVFGFATHVTREELPSELQSRFALDALFRCQVSIPSVGELTLYTSSIPRGWKLNQPIVERCRALAAFVKLLPLGAAEGDDRQGGRDPTALGDRLLFAAPRVAWFPLNLLGSLGMDYGLFDDVRDRSGLDEREVFYQMLAALSEASSFRVEAMAREQIVQRRDFLERIARNPHQSADDRAAAARALERGQDLADDVVPLFNQPELERGKLFTFVGDALRAVEVRVDEADIVERFGIDHYYEVEMVTPDSQNNPIVCCLVELPPDMPLGESIREPVRVAGYFLKTWAFDAPATDQTDSSSGDTKRKQVAPLLIGKSLQVLPPPRLPGVPATLLAAGLGVLVASGAILAWYLHRANRRALQKAGARTSLPERIALDDAPGD